MTPVVIVPGLGGSGEAHWQTHLQRSLPNSTRVQQDDWERPELTRWVERLACELETRRDGTGRNRGRPQSGLSTRRASGAAAPLSIDQGRFIGCARGRRFSAPYTQPNTRLCANSAPPASVPQYRRGEHERSFHGNRTRAPHPQPASVHAGRGGRHDTFNPRHSFFPQRLLCDNVYEPNALGLHRMTAVAIDVDNDLGCGPVVAEPNAPVGKYDRQGNCGAHVQEFRVCYGGDGIGKARLAGRIRIILRRRANFEARLISLSNSRRRRRFAALDGRTLTSGPARTYCFYGPDWPGDRMSCFMSCFAADG
jgi:hypothetical protein